MVGEPIDVPKWWYVCNVCARIVVAFDHEIHVVTSQAWSPVSSSSVCMVASVTVCSAVRIL
jgi:hypothetical protein